jgi:hypothetical protein
MNVSACAAVVFGASQMIEALNAMPLISTLDRRGMCMWTTENYKGAFQGVPRPGGTTHGVNLLRVSIPRAAGCMSVDQSQRHCSHNLAFDILAPLVQIANSLRDCPFPNG